MRCAIYARYSSDLQRSSSIDDQVRRCREYAGGKGWTVIEDYVNADRAKSATALAGREKLQSLIQAAKSKPRPFDYILVEDSSRLARDLGDSSNIVRTLQFHGVQVAYVNNGIDSGQKSAKPLLLIQGLMDEQYIDGLAEKVHRGQEGRVLAGFNPGGKIYGYRNVPIEDPTRSAKYGRPAVLGVRLEIVPEEAGVIRRMFDLYAAGHGLAAIAKVLNSEGVPAPQPPRNRPYRGWCPTAIRVMLQNERYRGVHVWNRTRKMRNPETGRKTSRQRPDADAIRHQVPEWRIVSDQQWEAVQRQRELVNASGIHRLGGQCRTESSRRYLFSGILKCAACGSNLVIVSGGGKRGYVKYGCPAHRYRGSCGNGLYIRQDRVEDQLLSALEARLFQPAILERITTQVRDGVRQRLKEIQQADAAGSLEALRHEERSLTAQADRLADAIARSGEMESLLARLKAVEQDLQMVRKRIAAGRPKDLQVTDDQVRQHVTKNLMSLSSLLTGEDILAARSALQKHIRQLVLTPVSRDGRKVYRVSGEVNLAGSDGCVMQVVARDGLEPPTPAFSGPRSTN